MSIEICFALLLAPAAPAEPPAEVEAPPGTVLIRGGTTTIGRKIKEVEAFGQKYDLSFNTAVRDAALARMAHAGAQLVNWFSVGGELHRDWRNDVEGFGGILGGHLPAYANLIQSYNQK